MSTKPKGRIEKPPRQRKIRFALFAFFAANSSAPIPLSFAALPPHSLCG
jgi:hypothetical protein